MDRDVNERPVMTYNGLDRLEHDPITSGVQDRDADWEAPPGESGGEVDDDGTVNHDSQPGASCGIPTSSSHRRSPPRRSRTTAPPFVKRSSLIQLLAPIVSPPLSQRRESFATRAVWDLVPEPKPRYRRLNAVGDVLGRGAGKQSLGLYRDSQGNFICCRENVCLAARRMTPAGLKALALRLGFPTRTDFEAAVNSLPSAQIGTPT